MRKRGRFIGFETTSVGGTRAECILLDASHAEAKFCQGLVNTLSRIAGNKVSDDSLYRYLAFGKGGIE